MPRLTRGRIVKDQYLSLLAKRPLRPADIHRLEVLALLLMHEKHAEVSNAKKTV